MSELKYKVGDRVKIKSLDWYNENKTIHGDIWFDNAVFVGGQSLYCGCELTIRLVTNDSYYVIENDYYWTDEMIEGLVEEETKPEPKFKVGDILFYRGETCGYLKVEEIREENGEIRYYETSRNLYLIENDPNVFADKVCSVETEETKNNNEMIEGLVEESDDFEKIYMESEKRYEEEYSKGEYCHEQSFKWGFQEGYDYAHENEKLEINLKNCYQFKDDNGNVINTQKIIMEKTEYPKTYEECCKVFGLNHYLGFSCSWNSYDEYSGVINHLPKRIEDIAKKLESLSKLLICLNAYWKLYGEEMGLGLGKPWSPDYTEESYEQGSPIKYVIYYTGTHITKERKCTPSYILSFPTPEMRDAFYENFKSEIEFCKELL